jgi:hypothetical protein
LHSRRICSSYLGDVNAHILHGYRSAPNSFQFLSSASTPRYNIPFADAVVSRRKLDIDLRPYDHICLTVIQPSTIPCLHRLVSYTLPHPLYGLILVRPYPLLQIIGGPPSLLTCTSLALSRFNFYILPFTNITPNPQTQQPILSPSLPQLPFSLSPNSHNSHISPYLTIPLCATLSSGYRRLIATYWEKIASENFLPSSSLLFLFGLLSGCFLI